MQVWSSVDAPADPHGGEAIPVPHLPLLSLQEGHDHQVRLVRGSFQSVEESKLDVCVVLEVS